MHIVSKVYDDNSADIMDIGPMTIKRYTFKQIENLKIKEIVGAFIYNNELLDIKPVKIISFPTEQEAIEYQHYYGGTIRYMLDYWWLLYEYNEIIHVDYLVYTQIGEEITYLSESGYTPYIQAAKCLDEVEAIKTARSMTKYSNTGKYWKVLRVPRG